ncbi:MAG TPA: hypothetical protein VKY44_08350 [Flavobacterium sp.]|nr:hypothetical protein [Flavobacterium sp.]
MRAKFENDAYVVYNDASVIGKIVINSKSHLNKNEIVIGNDTYKIVRDGWKFNIFLKDVIVEYMKMNSFTGNITVLELGRRIKGIFGLRWGTQMVDGDNNTLLKIRNENSFIDKGGYIIKIENDNVSNLEILLSLFAHLYGSHMKMRAVIMG